MTSGRIRDSLRQSSSLDCVTIHNLGLLRFQIALGCQITNE